MLKITYTLKLDQLLKIAQTLKNICGKTTTKISQPSVATMVDTHSKLDTTTIEVNNQMEIIQVQVGKNIVEDVSTNGKAIVNIITKNLKTKLGLSKPRRTPYHLRMAN
jgi:hypothetical protein